MPFLTVTSPQVTASAGGAASVPTDSAIVTTASLTTAAGVTATFTVSSPAITPNSLVMVAVGNGTNTTGNPDLASVTPGNGIVTIVIQNIAAAAALNGTLKLSVIVFN